MSTTPGERRFRCAVLSAVKHDYVPRGVASHPRFELVVVADDPSVPDWAHERNQDFADRYGIPYLRDVERALREYDVDVAIVSSEAERHCDLSIRATRAGKHVVQDKPLATRAADADRLLEEVTRSRVMFMMWNRNFFPAVLQAREAIASGAIGQLYAFHCDFYFAKDAGPPRGTRLRGYPRMDWLTHQIAAHQDGSDGGLGHHPLGEMANEGIYPLGYLAGLTGLKVRRVFAKSASHFHQLNVDNQVEDLISVTLELDQNIVASLAIGRIGVASHSSGGSIKFCALGTKGALVINEAAPGVAIHYRNQPPHEPRQIRIANDNDFLLADSFAAAIDGRQTPILDAATSHAIFRISDAALQSCRTGQPINLVTE